MNFPFHQFNNYSQFVDHIEAVATSCISGGRDLSICKQEIEVLLNGANSKAVSKYFSANERKVSGVFFTSDTLATRVAQKIRNELQLGYIVFDPTCGGGDLLLACTPYMPIKGSLGETVRHWERLLIGQDIYSDFCRSARSRLLLAAVERQACGSKRSRLKKRAFFSGIVSDDFLANSELLKKSDCILTNPPYGHVDVGKGLGWSTGRTQLAAVFMDKIIKTAIDGQRVIAILPDVLRSGTRYSKWREFVQKNSENLTIDVCGRFNNEADVDVFILDFVVKKQQREDLTLPSFSVCEDAFSNYIRVEDLFNVSVGPVVPHRDYEGLPGTPYLDVKSCPIWKEFTPSQKRGYECTLKKPPFVALRRTNSPSDEERLKATIVRGDQGVAVENHLIVLEPKDGKLSTCRKIMDSFRKVESIKWINDEIRCRHLTVSAIRKMPIF